MIKSLFLISSNYKEATTVTYLNNLSAAILNLKMRERERERGRRTSEFFPYKKGEVDGEATCHVDH